MYNHNIHLTDSQSSYFMFTSILYPRADTYRVNYTACGLS